MLYDHPVLFLFLLTISYYRVISLAAELKARTNNKSGILQNGITAKQLHRLALGRSFQQIAADREGSAIPLFAALNFIGRQACNRSVRFKDICLAMAQWHYLRSGIPSARIAYINKIPCAVEYYLTRPSIPPGALTLSAPTAEGALSPAEDAAGRLSDC